MDIINEMETLKQDTELFESKNGLSMLNFFLSLWGFEMNNPDYSKFNFLSFVAVHLFFIFHIFLNMFAIVTSNEISFKLQFISWLFNVTIILAMWHHFWNNKLRINHFFSQLMVTDEPIIDEKSKTVIIIIRGFILAIFIGFYVASILHVILVEDAINGVFYRYIQLTPFWMSVMILITEFSYLWFFLGFPAIYFATYCLLCCEIAYQYKRCFRLLDAMYLINQQTVLKIMDRYIRLAKIVESVNESYGVIILLSLISYPCLVVFYAIETFTTKLPESLFGGIKIVPGICITIVIILSGSAVILKANRLSEALCRLVYISVSSKQYMKNDIWRQYLLIDRLKPHMSGGRIFILNRGLLMAIFGISLTYIILILQLKGKPIV